MIPLAGAFFEEAIYNEELGLTNIVINRKLTGYVKWLKSTRLAFNNSQNADLLSVATPNQFLPETQTVIGHFDDFRFQPPQMEFGQPCDREGF